MASAVKLDIIIPEDHRLEIDLPQELPSGPAEVIVRSVASVSDEEAATPQTLADRFAGHTGLIDSGGQGLSEASGESFVDHLEAKRRAGHL